MKKIPRFCLQFTLVAIFSIFALAQQETRQNVAPEKKSEPKPVEAAPTRQRFEVGAARPVADDLQGNVRHPRRDGRKGLDQDVVILFGPEVRDGDERAERPQRCARWECDGELAQPRFLLRGERACFPLPVERRPAQPAP